MNPRIKPRIGFAVHYVSHGTPVRSDNTQAYTPQCRAADITEIGEDGVVGLFVKNPTGQFFHPLSSGGCIYDNGGVTAGEDCPDRQTHGKPFRYCACGWVEEFYTPGSWHHLEDCEN